MKVLVIEDDGATAACLVNGLREEGHAVDQAAHLMAFVQAQAHEASHQLALQRGLFPA